MTHLHVRLLGPFRVARSGRVTTEFETTKTRALLAYLAAEASRPHQRAALAEMLWPDRPEGAARANLRHTLASLRRTIDDCDAEPPFLLTTRKTIQFNAASDAWVDVAEFETLIGQGTASGCLDVSQLEDAVDLYRGSFLEDLSVEDSATFEEWALLKREQFRRQMLGVFDRLAKWYGQLGEYTRALEFARQWVELEPLDEQGQRQVMRLLALSDKRSSALAQYETCRHVLQEELGIEPSEETVRLYKQIQAGELTLLTPVPQIERPSFLEETGEQVDAKRPVFVARERELAWLDGFLKKTLRGEGRVIFITGGPGRGKTVLMQELARRAMETNPDLLVATGSCNAFSGEGDSYLPFRELLGMLTGDVEARWAAGVISREHAHRLWNGLPLVLQALVNYGPSLIGALLSDPALLSRATTVAPESVTWLPALRILSSKWWIGNSGLEQSAIFQQFANMLCKLSEAHPLLLMLDDMQWADSASISLLFHLGQRLEGSRILITCAYRPEEVALDREGKRHPLGKLLAEFRRNFGDVWLDLKWASEREGRDFVDGLLDTEPNRLGKEFRTALFDHAGGHPLFTVEMLRAMQERGDLVQDANGRWMVGPALDWERLPARVEAVVAERIGRLDENLQNVLAVASVEGERFTAQVVAQVQSIPEREILSLLSRELAGRHRLVREGGELRIDGQFLSRYQFTHVLFQEYLYRRMTVSERRLLHGEVAAVLEGLYGGQTAEIVAQLAYHYTEGGQTEKAIEYILRAGERSRLAYANEDAIVYFSRVLELLSHSKILPVRNREGAWRLEALKGLGQVYYRTGQIADAKEVFQEAITLGREMGLAPRELVRLYYWLGEVANWQDRYNDLSRIGEEGLLLLEDDTESTEAALMNQHIACGHLNAGNLIKFREFSHRTAQFLMRLPYSEELRPAYLQMSELYVLDKKVEQAMRWLRALEQEATQLHDLQALGLVSLRIGSILGRTGDFYGVIRQTQQALKRFTQTGDAKHEGECLLLIGEALLFLGDLQKAEEYANRGLQTAKVVGSKFSIAWYYDLIGLIALCGHDWERAIDVFQTAIQFFRAFSDSWGEAWVTYIVGRGYLAQGDRAEALRRFQEVVSLVEVDQVSRWYTRDPLFIYALCGLEQTHEDPAAFRAFCRRYQENHPEVDVSLFVQWFLESSDVGEVCEPPLHQDEFTTPSLPGWVWHDPFGDCSFIVENGLEIHAANGRDMRCINLGAPRMLRPVPIQGDFAVQTVCAPLREKKPAIGGLVIWKDQKNYLRLDMGTQGLHEISFQSCLRNQDVIIGRGRLEVSKSADRQIGRPSARVFLRLESIGNQVCAYCSTDGETWFTLGHVAFPAEGPVQVGLHAIGNLDRTVYHGAYPDGTAIRFESFQLWESIDR